MSEIGRFRPPKRISEYLLALGHDSGWHVRLHYRPRNRPAILPACHRNAKPDRQKKAASSQSHLAVNPFSRPLSVFAQTTYSSGYGEKVEKISLCEGAYVVTRDEHRGRLERSGERKGNDLVACRANWPWSFLIRSIYRARRVFRPLVLPFSLAHSPAASLSHPFIRRMQCCSKWNAEDLSISTFHQ